MDRRTAETVANDLIDFIRERTSKGVGKDGEAFPDYEKEYKESMEYKIAGKDGTVNLQLTGEMMDSLVFLSYTKGAIEIGYPAGAEINGRAEGNILGSYGGSPNAAKARNFLALSEREIYEVVKNYPVDKKSERIENLSIAELARELAGEIVDGIFFDYDEDDDE